MPPPPLAHYVTGCRPDLRPPLLRASYKTINAYRGPSQSASLPVRSRDRGRIGRHGPPGLVRSAGAMLDHLNLPPRIDASYHRCVVRKPPPSTVHPTTLRPLTSHAPEQDACTPARQHAMMLPCDAPFPQVGARNRPPGPQASRAPIDLDSVRLDPGRRRCKGPDKGPARLLLTTQVPKCTQVLTSKPSGNRILDKGM
ncbi:hypothetical protein KVR01_002793 [Diaporthe batatas]|uniref:uncharacterized protein n=1 Tax=Diaporthe batatas TaxID=748121 RepID=UPI001D0366E5|nr:uncharacterized protein KVR01_002793 [Diaporthe batatas]KAG8167104.1 hypothetical protein KVR01_002793 [Diaporthe batatas]